MYIYNTDIILQINISFHVRIKKMVKYPLNRKFSLIVFIASNIYIARNKMQTIWNQYNHKS